MAIDIYRRSEGSFDLGRLGDGDTLNIQLVGFEVLVKDLYEDVMGLIG